MPAVDRRIVFVDEDDDALTVTLVEQSRQEREGVAQRRQTGPAVEESSERHDLLRCQLAVVEHVAVRLVQLCEYDVQVRAAAGPVIAFHIFERDDDHGVALEMNLRFGILRDVQSLEQRAPVVVAALDEPPQRRQVEGLAETARSRQQHDLGRFAQNLADERCLVDVCRVRLAELAEVGDTERGAKTHLAMLLDPRPGVNQSPLEP